MAEKVGELYYDVTLETRQLLAGEREARRSIERTGSAFDGLGAKLSLITRAIGVYASALTLVKAARAADDVRLLGARVEVAAGSVERGAQALSELQRSAQRTGTELASNATIFARLNPLILQMGGNQRQTLGITELLAKGLKISGASAVETASSMTQFAQAIGSGKLAGDELRSLLENAPYLMRQLADGIGVPIGALKQLGEDGKLTSEVVVNALSKAADRIDADFKKLPATFEGAMAAASDAAARANEAFDTLTGTSAVLTGATRGVGEVLDMLADQFRAATSEGDKLSKGDTVKKWAEGTTQVLTYVVDAADFVARGFRQMGTAIGGVAASIGALARGELGQAREIMSQMAADVQAIGSGQLSGARMRQSIAAMATGTDGSDPMDRRARGAGAASALRAPASGGTAKKQGKFDAEGYMSGLREGTLEGIERIDAIETEAMRQAAERLKQRQLTHAQYAEAIKLIQVKSAQDRLAIQVKEAEDIAEALRQADAANLAAEKKAAEDRERGRSMARGVIGAADPVAALRYELEEKTKALTEAAARDQANAELYAEAQVALERETQRRLGEIRQREIDQQNANNAQSLAMLGQFTGDVFTLLQQSGRQRTALAKTAFLANKAIAVAEIIMNTEVAAAKAGAQLGIFGLPMAAMIRATGYASAGLVGGQAVADTFGGGRQFGGPVSAGTMYRVNETGRPEMFTAANGSQYMLPTQGGSVTPANEVGAASGTVVELRIINQAPGVSVSQRTGSDGNPELVIAEVAAQITERRGQVWRALGTTNVRGAV